LSPEPVPVVATVSQYLSQWTTGRAARGVASAADDSSRLQLHALPQLGHLKLADVRPRHLRDLVRGVQAKGTLAPRTIRHVYGVLHAMFGAAAESAGASVAGRSSSTGGGGRAGRGCSVVRRAPRTCSFRRGAAAIGECESSNCIIGDDVGSTCGSCSERGQGPRGVMKSTRDGRRSPRDDRRTRGPRAR
jgi:hypothetical protein